MNFRRRPYPPHFSAFIFEKIYIFYQKVISFLKKMSCLTKSTRFFIFGVVFQKWIFAEGRTPRTLVLVLITTHLTVRQITTHLTVRRVRTHIVSIFLLKYSNFDRKSPKINYYNIPYKNPKTHFSEKAWKPTFQKWVLDDLTHRKDTHMKYSSTILTFDFASVWLCKLIQARGL